VLERCPEKFNRKYLTLWPLAAQVAADLGIGYQTICGRRRWRSRFAERGVAGVGRIAKGRGRKPGLPPGTVAEVLRLTHQERPADGSTHGSTRTLAARVGIGKDAVAKIWADHSLKPWKVETFEVSNDPRFEDELVGLCLNPPARAVVFSFDEKTQCQAVEHYPAVAADETGSSRDDDP
jgi:hypothetical protein